MNVKVQTYCSELMTAFISPLEKGGRGGFESLLFELWI
jgi:hypothetical protein